MALVLLLAFFIVPLSPLLLSVMLKGQSLTRHISGLISLTLILALAIYLRKVAGVGDATGGGGLGRWYIFSVFQAMILGLIWMISGND
jgi:hypothetical protein